MAGKKRLLICEAHSLDHIGTMHASGIMKDETKYLGGLKIVIEFKSSIEANEYLDAKHGWKDWFKWLVNTERHDFIYERTA